MRRFPLGRLFPVLILGLLIAQGVSLLRRHADERTVPPAAVTGSEPAFRLRAADGHVVSAADLRGRWALVCLAPTGDEAAVRQLAGALGALGAQADRVAAVLIATDDPPASPDATGRAAGRFGGGVLGLTGERDAVLAAERAFGMRGTVRALVPGETPLAGSGPMIAVLGPDGRLRDTLPGDSNSETIAARLRTLGLHG